MFFDVKELAVRKIRIRKSYAPGTVDYHTGDFRQVEPLEVRATAELVEGQIRISGELHTRAGNGLRALPGAGAGGRSAANSTCFTGPCTSMTQEEEVRLKLDDTEIGFFEGEGLFLADVLAEQVLLAIPMKVICRSDCRGLCPHCGANLNTDECRCEKPCSRPAAGAAGASQAGLVQKAIALH